jgi:hypothetical protein
MGRRTEMDYMDIDGAYTAARYAPHWEANERRRWEKLHEEPWDIPACEIMEGGMPIGERLTNHGCGPSLGDLARVGYFDSLEAE